MKTVISIILILTSILSIAQEWKKEQLSNANTAANVSYLTKTEKETILYLNLARLYPKDFVKNELSNSGKGYYETSLIKTLKRMKPTNALVLDETLYDFAKCYSKEMGERGTVGHNRKKCKKGNFAECCSYGMSSGREIVLQLLIDDGISGLGHRKICLSEHYSKIGISIYSHKTYSTCAVLDIL